MGEGFLTLSVTGICSVKCVDVDWAHPAQDTAKQRAAVNSVMNHPIKGVNFLSGRE